MTSPWGEIWMSGIGVCRVFFLFLFEAWGLEDDDIGSCSWEGVLKGGDRVCAFEGMVE